MQVHHWSQYLERTTVSFVHLRWQFQRKLPVGERYATSIKIAASKLIKPSQHLKPYLQQLMSISKTWSTNAIFKLNWVDLVTASRWLVFWKVNKHIGWLWTSDISEMFGSLVSRQSLARLPSTFQAAAILLPGSNLLPSISSFFSTSSLSMSDSGGRWWSDRIANKRRRRW